MPNGRLQKCMKPSWTVPKSSYPSFSHVAASPAHHFPSVEEDHHLETAISTTDLEGHRAVTDHHPWADRDEDFPLADALVHHLVHMEADIEAGEAEVAEEVSAVVATTMDTGLDAHYLAHDLAHPGEACHTHGQGAHHQGAAEVEAATEGEILHEGVEAVATVEGAQAIVRTVATAAAGAGAEGEVPPGDRNAGQWTTTDL